MKLSKDDIVLFSGDSITDGNRVHKMDLNHIMGHGYQYIIAGRLALDNADSMPKFINKGYSGYTMGELLAKWQTDVIENKPTVLSILAGANDVHFGYLEGLTVDETVERYKTDLSKAIELTKEKLGDIKIIICEPFYFNIPEEIYYNRCIPHPECEEPMLAYGPETDSKHIAYRTEATDKIRFAAKDVARHNGCIFVPLYDKFKEAAKNCRMEYLVWDGTHPTVAGHMLIADEWLKAVNGL